jgi:hypothetical protein
MPYARGRDLVADGEVGLDAANEGEAGRAAMGTPRPREEQLEPPERVPLGGVQQPEGTDAVHTLRGDVLQESSQHLVGREREDLVSMIAAVAVPERHGALVHREEGAIGDRRQLFLPVSDN